MAVRAATPEALGPARAGPGGSRRGVLGAGLAGLVLLGMPATLPPYVLIQLSYALVIAIACLALNLVFGTTGLLSLGHAAYFGIGAYAGALLFHLFDLGSLEIYLLAGVLTATALAALTGAWCLRATRMHFTIMTLALGQLVHAVFVVGMPFRLMGDFGKGLFFVGHGGLHIPRLAILGIEPAPEQFIPLLYYVILAAFFASVAILWRITRSPFGLALRAIRDNDLRAALVGIPVRAYRWRALVISGALTGLAGGLHGQLDRQVTPEQLDWLFSAKLVVATTIGGTSRFLGPAAGAAVFVMLEDAAHRFALSHGLVLGSMLIAAVFTFPGGVLGVAARLRERLTRPGLARRRAGPG